MNAHGKRKWNANTNYEKVKILMLPFVFSFFLFYSFYFDDERTFIFHSNDKCRGDLKVSRRPYSAQAHMQ